MTPELVIFDCDGVLVDTEPMTNALIAANLTRHGLPITPEQSVQMFVGGTLAGVGARARELGANIPDDWVDGMYAEVFAALAEGAPVIAGVMDLLDMLEARGIAMAVASNGPMRKMELSLGPSGLWERLAGRIYSGHVHGPKPEPGTVLKAMEDAGVSAAQAVMIDDSRAGVLAARNAGVRAIGFAADSDAELLREAGAEAVFAMEEVAGLLGLT